MKYILTTPDGLSEEITLRNLTEVNSLLESEGVIYKVKEIIIINPESGKIELKCVRLPENLKSWRARPN